MAIKIAAWNVEGRLAGYEKSGRGTADHILDGIARLDADVLVLPEARLNEIAPGVDARLKELGYDTILEAAYGDRGREDEKYMQGTLYMRLLSRLPVEHEKIIRPGDVRNLLTCQVADPETRNKIRIIATHLDDRSESQRLLQVADLCEYVTKDDIPTIMLGDFNAMWRKGRGRLIGSRLVRSLAKYIPHEDLRYAAIRVNDMAAGAVLSKLTHETGLRDIDLRHQPTSTPKIRGIEFMPSIRLIQIDHMLVSSEVEVRDFAVGKEDGGSDHRPISATISVK